MSSIRIKAVLLLCFSLFIVNTSAEHGVDIIIKPSHEKLIPFNLNQIILLPSPFKHAQEMDGNWLLQLEPDRFLHRFHKNAGLEPKGEVYGGWESLGVGGQSMGHYMSACGMMYAATANQEFRKRTDYIVAELWKCQQARGTGYVGSIIHEDSIWAQVSRGEIYSSGFDLNGGWVPWYVLHKLFAGLYDTYIYTGNETAKSVLIKLSDWTYTSFKNLDNNQWQRILACEHGGMLEALVNVYIITGDEKYLEMSNWFNHRKIFNPLLHQTDSLAGLHANTQVPKIVGLAKRYAYTNSTPDQQTAHFFWETVTHNHTYCIGGNSDGEHFGPPKALSTRLSDRTTETCNTHNMLKLSKQLFLETGDVKYADFYEKAMYNHILASQNPKNGMVTYYVPLVAGGRRNYSSPFETFTCCVGTGFENHARYGEAIYFKDNSNGLYVNLYVPSRLNWNDEGIILEQQGNYITNGNVVLNFKSDKTKKFPLFLRIPYWTTNHTVVKVNGKKIKTKVIPGSYLEINRRWKKNDKVELEFDMPLYTDPMPDNPNRIAIKYGPVVLAGKLGNRQLDPLKDIPVLVTDNKPISEWITKVSADSALFCTVGVGEPQDIVLAPFYTLSDERYIVYFDVFDSIGWKQKKIVYQAYIMEQEEMAKRTVDFLQLGEMQPERDHLLRGEATDIGEFLGRKFRLCWNNGWFSYELEVKNDVPLQLVNTHWGSDGSWNSFDISIDGELLKSVTLKPERYEEFVDMKIDIPHNLTKNKKKITVLFKAHKDHMVGRLFGSRLVVKE